MSSRDIVCATVTSVVLFSAVVFFGFLMPNNNNASSQNIPVPQPSFIHGSFAVGAGAMQIPPSIPNAPMPPPFQPGMGNRVVF